MLYWTISLLEWYVLTLNKWLTATCSEDIVSERVSWLCSMFIIARRYSQSNESTDLYTCESLHRSVYVEEKAAYMNSIQAKTVSSVKHEHNIVVLYILICRFKMRLA